MSESRKRSYGQYCAVARSLDLLGGRWTLLIIRELLQGPRRFVDLANALPGMAPNLLSTRLSDLNRDKLIKKRKVRLPGSGLAYELTDRGRELETVLLALSRWGRPLMGPLKSGEQFSARWLLLGLRGRFSPADFEGVREEYEFRVGRETIHARVLDGRLETREGPAEEPDVVISASRKDFLAVALGQIQLTEAVKTGRITIEGDPAAKCRCVQAFLQNQTA